MLITTNQTITHFVGEERIATAELDRVLHHRHVLVIQGRRLPTTPEEAPRAARLGQDDH